MVWFDYPNTALHCISKFGFFGLPGDNAEITLKTPDTVWVLIAGSGAMKNQNVKKSERPIGADDVLTIEVGPKDTIMYAFYLSTPFLCNGGKGRLCVLNRRYAGTA